MGVFLLYMYPLSQPYRQAKGVKMAERCLKKTNQESLNSKEAIARKGVVKRCLLGLTVLLAASLATCLCGCSSAKYYQLDKFASLSSDQMLNELENGQGFTYQDKGWSGDPKDDIADALYNKPSSNTGGLMWITLQDKKGQLLSRDKLKYEKPEIGEVKISYTINNQSFDEQQQLADRIINQCGFTDMIYEISSEKPAQVLKMGKCQIKGQDALWEVYLKDVKTGGAWWSGSNTHIDISVMLLGDKDYEDFKNTKLDK